jgi:serine/threonine protein kinase
MRSDTHPHLVSNPLPTGRRRPTLCGQPPCVNALTFSDTATEFAQTSPTLHTEAAHTLRNAFSDGEILQTHEGVTVRKVTDVYGTTRILKSADPIRADAKRRLRAEVDVMCELHKRCRGVGPGLVSVGIDAVGCATHLVMEYLDRTTELYQYLNSLEERAVVDFGTAVFILTKVVDTLCVMHAAGVVHGDIKAENIMVHFENGVPVDVVLIDFGSSRCTDTATAAPAPDSAAASDVRMVGRLLFTLLTKRLLRAPGTDFANCIQHTGRFSEPEIALVRKILQIGNPPQTPQTPQTHERLSMREIQELLEPYSIRR